MARTPRRPLPPPVADPPQSRDGRGRGAAFGVYLLYLLTFFTAGLSAVAGGVWAHVAIGEAEEWVRTHLRRQIRLFWIGLLVGAPLLVLWLVGQVLKWVLIGYPILWMVWIVAVIVGLWFLWNTVTGLTRLAGGRPTGG